MPCLCGGCDVHRIGQQRQLQDLRLHRRGQRSAVGRRRVLLQLHRGRYDRGRRDGPLELHRGVLLPHAVLVDHVPVRLLLPCRLHGAHRVPRRQALPRELGRPDRGPLRVPRGILLPAPRDHAQALLQQDDLPVRLPLPAGDVGAAEVRFPVLLPERRHDGPGHLPHRLQLPQRGHVRCHPLPAGHLGLLRGEGAVRRLPGRPLLPQRHYEPALPGRLPLPGEDVPADPVPGRLLLLRRLQGAGAVPARLLLPGRRVGQRAVPGRLLLPDGRRVEHQAVPVGNDSRHVGVPVPVAAVARGQRRGGRRRAHAAGGGRGGRAGRRVGGGGPAASGHRLDVRGGLLGLHARGALRLGHGGARALGERPQARRGGGRSPAVGVTASRAARRAQGGLCVGAGGRIRAAAQDSDCAGSTMAGAPLAPAPY
mmetsp:Transcript_52469/g.109458  ORF Transcript_52469/g.109458 Transcript_52469/m.109458 type:complete len:424 (+) Transcript_52469:492-1763(+)